MQIASGSLTRIRRAILRAARRTGIFSVASRSTWRNNRLLILCYHGISVADEHEWNSDLYASQEAFRHRLELLRCSGSHVVPLSAGVDMLRRRTLPPNAVSITFDDGNHDFSARALPVLRDFGYPATVYVATFYSGRREPVFTVGCHYVAWRGRKGTVDLRDLIGGDRRVVRLESPATRAAVSGQIVQYAERCSMSADEKFRLLGRFAKALGVDLEGIVERRLLQIMDADEIRAAADAGVDVELHTHRHRTPDDRDLFLQEIRDNRDVIREITGTEARHFCYPSGVCRPQFLPWLRDAGVVSATTMWPGLATRQSDNLLLPRFADTGSVSDLEFEGWLSGAAALFPLAKALVARRKWH